MEISLSEDQIKRLIVAELQGNLQILIDPKQKNSFSEGRIHTWTNVVSNRLFYHFSCIQSSCHGHAYTLLPAGRSVGAVCQLRRIRNTPRASAPGDAGFYALSARKPHRVEQY